MPHRTFLAFIAPSLVVMLLFIALPILSVAYQSLFVEHEQVVATVENCGPFGCTTETRVDTEAMAALRAEQPMGRFNWLGTYTNASHLAFAEVGRDLARCARHRRRAQGDDEPALLQGAVLHGDLHRDRHPARHHPRLPDRARRQRCPEDPQGSGDLLLAPADDRDAADRQPRALLDDRQPRRDRRGPAAPLRRPRAVAQGVADADLARAVLLRRLAPRAVQLHRLLRRPADRSPTTRSSRRWSTAPAAGSASASW